MKGKIKIKLNIFALSVVRSLQYSEGTGSASLLSKTPILDKEVSLTKSNCCVILHIN